jgi:hypothetical protein
LGVDDLPCLLNSPIDEKGLAMDVTRISQQRDASVSQSATPRRDARSAERLERAPSAERSEPAARPEPQKVRPTESTEKPRPVVNTQGQTPGTRVNTSA